MLPIKKRRATNKQVKAILANRMILLKQHPNHKLRKPCPIWSTIGKWANFNLYLLYLDF